MKRILVITTEEIANALEQLATEWGISRNAVINVILSLVLKKASSGGLEITLTLPEKK